ncbi:SRPBCC family protein [Actinoplanes sp. KI2]|uniref:SRPBCC family protein n=1 Tax=Actinoplanes sp. KI2 TaxID=2983315 RepID=UPI0021D5D8BA|nr:SRPBCC family protein [Actinoplanes sp. KI2]MCU7728505.1 SRPBCC family protein [Actinoplanes sp. KI2]
MSTDPSRLADLPGLMRVESIGRDELVARCQELTLPAYPHQQIYGTYCTIQQHVECPPEQVYEYLRQGHHLEEWTYSLRDFEPSGVPGLWAGHDRLADDTRIYCRTVANPGALTVDYHCSWDQGEELWMIYLMRVIPAALVLGRSGSVVTWTNCRHPHYDRNPHPELAPRPDRPWVGDYWDLFYAGHTVEMNNLKTILEHRYAAGLPVSVPPVRAVAR